MTRNALVVYSVGLVGLILVKVLAPGFYARQDIRTPVRMAMITLATYKVMNLAVHRDFPARRAGSRHWPRRLPQRGAALSRAAPERDLQSAVGLVTVPV